MKRRTPLLALVIALGAAMSWGVLAKQAGPEGPSPWHNPALLSVDGVRLGMTSAQMTRNDVSVERAEGSTRWNADQRVSFAIGRELREGDKLLASSRDAWQTVLQKLGTSYASGGHYFFSETAYDYYRAGSHWVILRYQNPRFFNRSAPAPEFALAESVETVADQYWGRDILKQALGER